MIKDLKKYRLMDKVALLKELASLKRDFFKVKMAASTGAEKNTAKVRSMRRSVAQLKTLLSEKKYS